MDKNPLIKIEGVSKSFGKGDAKVDVLKDISIEIYPGEYVVLFGPSGCGKSTLLNCIAGLEVPDTGKVVVRGQELARLSKPLLAKYRNKKIGMVFQQFNVLKSFNVITNIAMPQTLNGTGRRRRLERARHLLSIFGLDKIAKRLPTEISGGQQQRVAIARALVNNPWILIADEPTGNLDSKAASEVMELLAKLNENSHRTLILVTHNPEYLYAPHRIFYMKDGKIDREVVNRSINKEVTEADINNDQLLKEAASESIKQSEERKGMA